jgi:hypothetical protein
MTGERPADSMNESRPGLDGQRRAARITRWVTAVAVLPIPAWFSASALLAPAPAWRAEYRPGKSGVGQTAVVAERKLEHYWDRSYNQVPGGVDVHGFSAEWSACLSVAEAREVPFLLVANGTALLSLDAKDVLRTSGEKDRQTVGGVLRLEPGTHVLRVSLEARGWPSVALEASFDGRHPVAVGSGEPVAGVRLWAPRPGPTSCASDG